MADSFIIRIDVKRLRENAASAGEEMTPAQVMEWLRHSGFRERPDGSWLCEQISLDLLDKSEIIEAQPF